MCEGCGSSKLRLHCTCILTYELFNLCELIVELQTFLVRQCVRRLDNLARNNLLNRKLDFFEVDRSLWH